MTTTIEDRTTPTKTEGMPCRQFYIDNQAMQLVHHGYPLIDVAPAYQIQLRFHDGCAVLSVPLPLDIDDIGDILGNQIGAYLKNPLDYDNLFEPAADRFQELINEALKLG